VRGGGEGGGGVNGEERGAGLRETPRGRRGVDEGKVAKKRGGLKRCHTDAKKRAKS